MLLILKVEAKRVIDYHVILKRFLLFPFHEHICLIFQRYILSFALLFHTSDDSMTEDYTENVKCRIVSLT